MAFYDDLVGISVSDERTGEISGERDLRFVYVYEGRASLSVGGVPAVLHKDDFYAINSGDFAEFVMEQPGFIAVLNLKYGLVVDYLELRRYLILCSSLREQGAQAERIGMYLRRMFSVGMDRNESEKALLLSDAFGLMHTLRENFRIKRADSIDKQKDDEEKRVELIRRYITENYNERFTLEDLSKETYFSVAYLSKYIKKNFGKNFTELLQDLRLEHAEKDLKETDLSITTIAMENGFASPIAFSRAFRDKFNVTPSEYRQSLEEKRRSVDHSEKKPDEIDERLSRIVKSRSRGEDSLTVNSRELRAKVSEPRRFKRFWSRMINGGTARDLMRADLQEHIILMHRELGFEYVRFWDIYSPEMMMFDGNAERRYNFIRLDGIIDFLIRNGMRPYIELGPKPNLLLRNTHDYLISERRQRIAETPEQYGDFVEKLARHYAHKYGVEEIEKWYFELWAETYSTDIDEYLSVFGIIQNLLKAISPRIRLGGAGESGETAIPMENIVQRWSESGTGPDFFTFYAYPYEPMKEVLPYEERLSNNSTRIRNPNFVERLIGKHTSCFHENGFWDQEIHISEWNSTIANRNILNDSVYKGAYVVKNIIAMLDRLDIVGYWFASDLFTEFYDTQHLLNGSGGLISKDGIRKPSFYGLSFFNRLETYMLAQSEDAVITANARGSYSIVCHNYRHPSAYYYTLSEDGLSPDSLEHIFDREQREFHFVIDGVKNGNYQIKTRVIDSHHGSVLDEWKRMGMTDHLNEQDIEYLRRICVPHITIQNMEVVDGKIDIHSILEANAIENIHIYLIDTE